MYAKLPKLEIYLYFAISLYVMYSFIINVYRSSDVFLNHLGGDENIVEGWSWLGRFQDISDEEWTTWASFIQQNFIWYVLHLLLAEITCHYNISALPVVYMFVCVSYVIFNINAFVACAMVLEAFAVYMVSLCNSKLLIWSSWITFLYINHSSTYLEDVLPDQKLLLVDISLAWLMLKCVDYCCNKVGCDRTTEEFYEYYGYVFYFPTFFFGPFIPSQNFCPYMCKRKENPLSSRVAYLLLALARISIWSFAIGFASHFLYSHALHYHLKSIIFKNLWTLNGLGFCMAQFFYLKYLVFYGTGGYIACFEGYKAPPPPRCVNRVHLYSQMWRYFDRGYYLFIFNNIYKPLCLSSLCSNRRKFLASFLSFSFVMLWHGVNYTIFYWSLFNFIGITLEAVGKSFSSSKYYKHFEGMCGSSENVRRVSCLFFSPMWVLAVFSNYFFFGGHKYGFKCFEQFVNADWTLSLFTILTGYCISQVSIEVENKNSFIGNYHSNLLSKIS